MRKLYILFIAVLLLCPGCTQQEIETTQAEDADVAVFPQLGHGSEILSVAISPDGKRIVSGSEDNTLKLWDVETGREIRTFLGHLAPVSSVAFSPDGKYILSGVKGWDILFDTPTDYSLRLWDAETGLEIRTFPWHIASVNSVAFSPDGKRIVSGSDDNTVRIWDIDTGVESVDAEEKIRAIDTHGSVESVAFSSDGKKVLIASSIFVPDETYTGDYSTYKDFMHSLFGIWDFEAEGVSVSEMVVENRTVTAAVFSPGDNYVLFGGEDDTLALLDIEAKEVVKVFFDGLGDENYKQGRITSVAFSPDGKYIISSYDGFAGGTVKLWDAETAQELRTFYGHTGAVNSAAFSPDGKNIISGSSDKTTKLWDVETGQVSKTYSGYAEGISVAIFHPDGKQILSASNDTSLKLWDSERWRLIRTFWGHGRFATSAAFSSDGKQFISSAMDNTIKLWDTNTGMIIGNFPDRHKDVVHSVAFSPDDKYILSSEIMGTAIISDAETGQKIRSFSEGKIYPFSTAFSPDGKYVLLGYVGTITLLETETGREIKTLEHDSDNELISGFINSVAFSPNGKFILSGSSECTIKLWDVETGECLITFEGHTASINSVAFSPDGESIISGSDDGTIKLWDTTTGEGKKTFRGHTSAVESVVFSPDGNKLLSCSSDGTVRLWDAATGNEIVAFISFSGGEWIVITPDGYYNASPKGDQYLNVRIGSEVFGIDQFATAFYRPDVVEARLQGKEKDPAVVKLRGDIRKTNAPPRVDITVINQDTLGDTAELAITISDQFKSIGETSVEIIVNGRLLGKSELQAVTASKSTRVGSTRLLASSQDKRLAFIMPVKLDPGFNLIEVTAANDFSYGFKTVTLNAPETEMQLKGDLRILAIGVNKYVNNSAYNLAFPASDANKIIDSFMDQGGTGKLYNQVHIRYISDNDSKKKPTRQTILSSLDFLKQAKPHDTVMLFLSGHGKTEDGVYYFLPSNTTFTGTGMFNHGSAVNVEEFVNALDIPGRKILLLDTCDSGGADTNNRLVRTLRNRSTVIFTASQDGEQAWENRKYGGFFAHSIAEGINGKVTGGENKVRIIPLGEYISERVEELNKETGTPPQHPMKYIPDGFQDFVISMVE